MSDEASRATELAAHYAICDRQLRAASRDLWLASLYAPRRLRGHVHALHAFSLEIGDVREKVSQPLLGEMRLRWWTDAILTEEAGARAHPIADALLDTIAAQGLSRDEFVDFLDAHSADLYDDRMPSTAELLDYCRRVAAQPLRWTAHCLGARDDQETLSAFDDAGVAMGLIGVLLQLRRGLGRQFLPLDLPDDPQAASLELLQLASARYQSARAIARSLDEPARIALLPAAGLPLYFESLRTSRDEPSPWRRQWRLWRAARKGL
ncbi:MAG TPA: squalene/phytoene synthase family protein [Methylocystis sp.]|nr:squalene/phytoene synthase family protein [Methylocystis sp.]